jgi:hypothetical protein
MRAFRCKLETSWPACKFNLEARLQDDRQMAQTGSNSYQPAYRRKINLTRTELFVDQLIQNNGVTDFLYFYLKKSTKSEPQKREIMFRI